jgi:hypothetical protein
MISPEFDIDAFVAGISHMDFLGMKRHCDWECDAVDSLTKAAARGAPAARARGAYEYKALISALVGFLHSGTRPHGLSDHDFLRFLPVALRLRELGFPATVPGR